MARPRTRPLGPFGKRLQRQIERLGVTHQTLCDRAGINKATLWRWMTGDRPPGLERASRLAKTLSCRVEEIFPNVQKKTNKTAPLRAKRVATL